MYFFTRFLHNGLSLLVNFHSLFCFSFCFLSACIPSALQYLYFSLYFTTLPILSCAFSLPVCPQDPNIFQFLLHFLYIYQYNFSLCSYFLLNIPCSSNSVSSFVFRTLDNSPLFTVHHVCYTIVTLKLNPHFCFKYIHLCLCLFVLLFFLNISLSQLNVPVCYTHSFLALVGINGLVSVRCLTFCMKNFDLRKK